MRANVAQCPDWNLRSRHFERNSASICVGDGDRIVHIWESGKQLVLDSLNAVIDRWRDTLYGGSDAEDVLRSHTAIRIAEALECMACESRLWSGSCGSQRQLVQRGRGRSL